MSAPTDLELAHGVDVEPLLGERLRAGPIEVTLHDGELRYMRAGDVELVRRVHPAVRDAAWNTIRGARRNERLDRRARSFSMSYETVHRAEGLAFACRCSIVGSDEGTVSFALDGVAEDDALYRRIGLCVLHPTTFAGCVFEASGAGRVEAGRLPELVAPQLFDGEAFPPLFAAFDRLRLVTRAGLAVTLTFDGDLFEIEDQRNWTDASFKSYSRSPEARVEPWTLARGTRIRQRVAIALESGRPPEVGSRSRRTVSVGDIPIGTLPALGVALHPPDLMVSAQSVAALREVRLDHLRVDLRLDDVCWRGELRRALACARELGCGLELAAFMGAADGPDAQALADELTALAPELRRVLVLSRGAEVTDPELVRLVRACCGEAIAGVPVGGGTDLHFAELNRHASVAAQLDVLAYPVTPEVHADDDLSLVETPPAQADTVARAAEMAPGRHVAVTPITLKPRHNPDAPEAAPVPGELPANVDVRQMSLLAAGWTLASVGRLGAAGAASATYFETVGWRGLIESDAPPASEPPFPSHAAMVFPVYHVLRALARAGRAPLLGADSSDPLAVQAVHVLDDHQHLLIVANLRGEAIELALGPLPGPVQLQRLDVEAARRAGADRRALERSASSASPIDGELGLALRPFELAFLTWSSDHEGGPL